VSLLSRDRVVVAIEPHAVHAVRPKTGEKRSVAVFSPEAIKQLVDGWQRADVTVVVSNRLVRYAVVPRSAQVSGEAEELELARHHFVRVHGERARDWDVRYSPETGLASAIDKSLIEELKNQVRLRSLQPYLMAAFNRLRSRVPKEGAWIVLPEAQATCVALYAKGAWAGVSVSRATGETAIERERMRMGSAQAPNTVLSPPGNDGYAMAMSAQ
jgi:hypothetical protein